MMPFEESKSEFSFWALWASPLIVATDPRDMSDEKRAILLNEEVSAHHSARLKNITRSCACLLRDRLA